MKIKDLAEILGCTEQHARRLKAASDPRVKRAEKAWRAKQPSEAEELDRILARGVEDYLRDQQSCPPVVSEPIRRVKRPKVR